jgi:hypothetical protein
MNGPSVTWRRPPWTRIVVAIGDGANPSHAISTPAACAASPNACHAAISAALLRRELLRRALLAVQRQQNLHLRHLPHVAVITCAAGHAEDGRPMQDRQRQRANCDRQARSSDAVTPRDRESSLAPGRDQPLGVDTCSRAAASAIIRAGTP